MVAALLSALVLAHPTSAANRLAAQRDAAALLSRAVLPAGASRLAQAPDGLLRGPFQTPVGKLVDRHSFWLVPEPLAAVEAFVKEHPPLGSQREGSGSGSAGGPRYPANETLFVEFPALGSRVSYRWLNLTLAALPDGSTAVRVDAQEIWVVPRPAAEVVPRGVDEIALGDAGAAHRVTRPGTVARIVRWFDALPIAQPGAGFSCPATVSGPIVKVDFRSTAGRLVARALMPVRFRDESLLSTACTPILFSIGGRKQTPLAGGDFFLRVERLLGIRLG